MFPQLKGAPNVQHGATPRGLDGGAASGGHGRFGRMFAALPPCELSDDALAAMETALELAPRIGENPSIPAGFTYLGQFIDHDITFDPNSQIDKVNDPLALTNFRSPRLDLDSLYGSGPADQPYLYDWEKPDPGVRFLIDETRDGEHVLEDVPRNVPGRALIGDPRNDVHLILAQLHLLFLRFHNAVVAHVRREQLLAGSALFREACRIVRWHYQWIIVHDYLPRVVGRRTATRVIKADGAWPPVERRHFRWEREPFIPVEFSGAAFRFGHSMVRDSYAMGYVVSPPGVAGSRPGDVAPPPSSPAGHLTGHRKLIPELAVDWAFFFEIDPVARPQESMAIDRGLALSLSSIPDTIAEHPSLGRMNLQRGVALGLPSGQAVAQAIGEDKPLSAFELFEPDMLRGAAADVRESLERSTPLWYYVLAEAASRRGNTGQHLGPVGGVIVAEVLMGLLEADPQSYLSQAPAWTPELEGAKPGKFTMADLVTFTNGPYVVPAAGAAATALEWERPRRQVAD